MQATTRPDRVLMYPARQRKLVIASLVRCPAKSSGARR
jgi:hypothetical protein